MRLSASGLFVFTKKEKEKKLEGVKLVWKSVVDEDNSGGCSECYGKGSECTVLECGSHLNARTRHKTQFVLWCMWGLMCLVLCAEVFGPEPNSPVTIPCILRGFFFGAFIIPLY